jgi:hypothetical protein
MTGSGKSYFVKTFITRARLVLGTNALILDWAGEYSDWVKAAGGKAVSLSSEGINLLDPGGTSPHNRMLLVLQSLDILTDLSTFPHQRRLTSQAIQKCYEQKGFPLSETAKETHRKNSKRLPPPPTLEDVCKELSKMAAKDPEAIEAHERINSLLISSGSAFTKQTLPLSTLVSGLVCVDLHSLPTESLRSLAGLAILQFVKEKMRSGQYSSKGSPKLFVVVDEAWKIAADERSDVVSIVREGRKYGFGLIVASQSLTDVHKSIFANAGTVAAFRLALASERDYLRSSLAYSDYFERASLRLSLGQPIIHLAFSKMVSCPKTFILKKVDGEEPITNIRIRGDSMDLCYERAAFARLLLSEGLTDRQATSVLCEFDKKSGTLDAASFVLLLEKAGMGKPSSIMLLRGLGASEKDILATFASLRPPGPNAAMALSPKEKNASYPPAPAKKKPKKMKSQIRPHQNSRKKPKGVKK